MPAVDVERGRAVAETYRHFALAGRAEIVIWLDTGRGQEGKPLVVELARLSHEAGTELDVTLRRHGWERVAQWHIPPGDDDRVVALVAPTGLPERVNGSTEDSEESDGETGNPPSI